MSPDGRVDLGERDPHRRLVRPSVRSIAGGGVVSSPGAWVATRLRLSWVQREDEDELQDCTSVALVIGAAALRVDAARPPRSPRSSPAEVKAERGRCWPRPRMRSPTRRRRPQQELTLVLIELSQAVPDLDGAERPRRQRRSSRAPTTGPTTATGTASPSRGRRVAVLRRRLLRPLGRHDQATSPIRRTATGPTTATAFPTSSRRCSTSAEDSFARRKHGPRLGRARRPTAPAAEAAPRPTSTCSTSTALYFGYASPDEGQGAATQKQAYLVLDDDYKRLVSAPSSPRSTRSR